MADVEYWVPNRMLEGWFLPVAVEMPSQVLCKMTWPARPTKHTTLLRAVTRRTAWFRAEGPWQVMGKLFPKDGPIGGAPWFKISSSIDCMRARDIIGIPNGGHHFPNASLEPVWLVI